VLGKPQFGDVCNGAYTQDFQRRVAAAIATDISHAEKNVLYLEALLDRAKLDAIRELAQQLREDRKELTRLLDEFSRTRDPTTQQALVEQMQSLKQRMLELQQRMAELSKGIRDDFMNAEALQQMQEEFGLESSLDEVERLVKEGKAEEALKKMQELAMEMDDFLEKLDQAGDQADQQQDPELSRQFKEFQDNLDEAVQKQDQVAEKTRALRDKYRQQQKERIAKQGEALKRELKEKLEDLDKSWKQLDGDRFGFRFEDIQKDAMQARDNVQQSLDANDFDLASEAADRMEDKARQMAAQASEQRRLEEQYNNPPEARRESRQAADKLARDAKTANEVAQKLRDLFPQPGQNMSEQDRQQMNELARQQKQLQQQAQQLQQQMESIGERAPIFNEEAQQQMEQAGQRMQGAGERLSGKDASRGYGEQQGAMQALRGIQQALEQAGNGSGKGGIPLPMRGHGRGRSNKDQKVEIPDEDPNAAPREFRKDVMDTMKQGAPDRYKDQNKKYYEELVK
jgi:myosin heavy subunit